MIVGIGIDSVEISRFSHWHNYTRLRRVFSQEELAYCLSNPAKSAERFAARFAAKEAFYKAAGSLGGPQVPFLKIARHIQVISLQGRPVLQVNCKNNPGLIHLSLTHTKTIATAVVIIEKI